MSKKLVLLKDDVPVKDKIENFIIKEVNKDKLYSFLREMEFNRLLSQTINFYGEPNNKKISFNGKKNESQSIDLSKYVMIKSLKQLDEWVSILKEKHIISVDTETTSLNP